MFIIITLNNLSDVCVSDLTKNRWNSCHHLQVCVFKWHVKKKSNSKMCFVEDSSFYLISMSYQNSGNQRKQGACLNLSSPCDINEEFFKHHSCYLLFFSAYHKSTIMLILYSKVKNTVTSEVDYLQSHTCQHLHRTETKCCFTDNKMILER